jgi:hypothetical protein
MQMKTDQAVYCWNPDTGQARMSSRPLPAHLARGWWTAGAVMADYAKFSPDDQRMQLLIEAWQSVVRDGIRPAEAHQALLKVDGMRELFADDCQDV